MVQNYCHSMCSAAAAPTYSTPTTTDEEGGVRELGGVVAGGVSELPRLERAQQMRRSLDGLNDMDHAHVPFVVILHLAATIWKLEVSYMYACVYMY